MTTETIVDVDGAAGTARGGNLHPEMGVSLPLWVGFQNPFSTFVVLTASDFDVYWAYSQVSTGNLFFCLLLRAFGKAAVARCGAEACTLSYECRDVGNPTFGALVYGSRRGGRKLRVPLKPALARFVLGRLPATGTGRKTRRRRGRRRSWRSRHRLRATSERSARKIKAARQER